MVTIYYCRDQTYKKGVNMNLLRDYERMGKPMDEFYNEKKTAIYICWTARGKYTKVNSKIKVYSKLWDEKAQRVKKQHSLALEINHRLTQLKADIEKSVLTLIARNPDYMADDVKDLVEQLVNGKINHSQQTTFWNAFDMYISEKRKLCKDGTVKKVVTTYNLLLEFQKLHYTLTFEKINNDFKVDLLSYMTDEKKYLNNNISKHFSIIKTFMRWTSEKEYHANTKFEQIKYQSDVVDVLALTEEELEKIINVNLSFSKSLEKTRDIFVFACLTGQRFSDLKNLRLGDLNLESTNPTWTLYQVKGNKRKKITVPLLPKAVEILKKQCDFSNPIECYAFKIQCNQKMNQNIKVVAELAKVNSPVSKNRYSGKKRIDVLKPKHQFITVHTARKTFVTLNLLKGLQPDLIRSITGHEDHRVMLRYLQINEQTTINEFNKIWK